MNLNDQNKVISAGFTIIRSQDYPNPSIKYRDTVKNSWKTLEKFISKAARDRRMKELLNDNKVITD